MDWIPQKKTEKHIEKMTDNKTLFPTTFATEKEEIKSLKNELDEKDDKIIELLEEQKKLRKENKALNFQVDAIDKQATDLCLKNTKLKEENKMVKIQRDGGREKQKRLDFAIKKLNEENKKHEDRVKYLEDLVGLGQIEHLEKMRDNDE